MIRTITVFFCIISLLILYQQPSDNLILPMIESDLFLFFPDSYEEKEIQLRWLDCAPIEIKKSDLQLPQFHLVDYWPTKCTESYKTGMQYANVMWMWNECSVNVVRMWK